MSSVVETFPGDLDNSSLTKVDFELVRSLFSFNSLSKISENLGPMVIHLISQYGGALPCSGTRR